MKYDDRMEVCWSHDAPVYSETHEQFFQNAQEIQDFLADDPTMVRDMKLVNCIPMKLSYLDYDYWCDELPPEQEIPTTLADAIDKLNDAITFVNNIQPVGFEPGTGRIEYEYDQNTHR